MKSNEITIYEELGHGAFGKVCKGIMTDPLCMKTGQSVYKTSKKIANSAITVAVKMLQGMLLCFYECLSITSGSVHTTLVKFENKGLNLKTANVFCSQYATTQHNTTQHNTTIQYNTIQHSTTQHNTMQYNSIQCSTYSLRHRKCGVRGFVHELFVSKTRTSEIRASGGF